MNVACLGTIQRMGGPRGSARIASTVRPKQRAVLPEPARPMTNVTGMGLSEGVATDKPLTAAAYPHARRGTNIRSRYGAIGADGREVDGAVAGLVPDLRSTGKAVTRATKNRMTPNKVFRIVPQNR